jgi:two-component system response regulator FixJ
MFMPEPSQARRVGIVDDDEAVRDAIHILLETHGFLVSEYCSVQDYLSRPQDDCVLLIDLSMAGFDGLDLVDILRKGGIRTPIVLMTDVARPAQARRISAAERCLRLQKPADPRSILAAIAASMSMAAVTPPAT